MKSWLIKHQTTVDRLPQIQMEKCGPKNRDISKDGEEKLKQHWQEIDRRLRLPTGITPNWLAENYSVNRSDAYKFLKRIPQIVKAGSAFRYALLWQQKNKGGVLFFASANVCP